VQEHGTAHEILPQASVAASTVPQPFTPASFTKQVIPPSIRSCEPQSRMAQSRPMTLMHSTRAPRRRRTRFLLRKDHSPTG
jgi:hypothetical protein